MSTTPTSRGRARNRDVGKPGHPTRFAAQQRPEPQSLDLGADDFTDVTNDSAYTELVAYRDAVTSGAVAPVGVDRRVVDGQSFKTALDRAIEYAARGRSEAADALRFHRMRFGTSEQFTVDGRTFTVTLSDIGKVTLRFGTTVESLECPDMAGMTDTDRRSFTVGAHKAVEATGVQVEGGDGPVVELSVPARAVSFNSLPDCVSKVIDAELDAFIAADNFRTEWRRQHVMLNDDWLDGESVRFV